jgi:DNA-binding response OmpR family regulator
MKKLDSVIHILFIEEDEWIRESFSVFFEKNGYRLSFAGTAEEGLKKIEKHEFDVIIIDNVLPGTNGIDCLKRLKDIRAVKIFISGLASDEENEYAFECGADDCLSKPFDVESLEKKILALVKAKSE